MKIKKFNKNIKFTSKYAILMNEKYLIQETGDYSDDDNDIRFDEHELKSILNFYEKVSSAYPNENYRIVKVFVESADEEIEILKNANKYNL